MLFSSEIHRYTTSFGLVLNRMQKKVAFLTNSRSKQHNVFYYKPNILTFPYFSIRHSRYFLEKSLHFSDWWPEVLRQLRYSFFSCNKAKKLRTSSTTKKRNKKVSHLATILSPLQHFQLLTNLILQRTNLKNNVH